MEALVFVDSVMNSELFDRDGKARTVTVTGKVEGIIQRPLDSIDPFGKDVPAQRGSIEPLEVGSVWSFRDDKDGEIKPVTSGSRQWFVLVQSQDGPF